MVDDRGLLATALEATRFRRAAGGDLFPSPGRARLSTYLPADAVAEWMVRFVAGAFMGWAAFYLLPRLWVRLGLAPGDTNSCPEIGAR